ncbi:hypothetical protein KKG48_00095 [Patescibacteria group bacterium]|nr:hypothetical protein [Patescibacteria group bacterium]MCG2694673.1 hypothetical protein [Candidatus Parcubacteria bacterium]
MKTYITPEKILEMTFGDNIPKIPEIVYIFFYKSMIKRVEQHFELEKAKFTRGDFYIEKNKKFGVVTNFGNGESGALMLAEELSAVGVKKVIAIGAVGSLSNDLKMEDTIIIESAFSQSNIGLVYDYKKEEVFTSNKQNQEIEEVLKKDNFEIKFVKTLSVPTIYRETEEEIEKAKQKNISVIEMEVFSLAMIFSLKNVEFSAIGCVSDVLDSEGWSFDDGFKKVFDCLENIFLKINK